MAKGRRRIVLALSGASLAAVLCYPSSPYGSPPRLVVQTPVRAEFLGRPTFVGFHAEGTYLVAAGQSRLQRWDWPLTGAKHQKDREASGPFAFDGQFLADLVENQVARARNVATMRHAPLDFRDGPRSRDVEMLALVSPTCLVGKKGEAHYAAFVASAAQPGRPTWHTLEFLEGDAAAHIEMVWACSADGRTLAGWGRFQAPQADATPGANPPTSDRSSNALYLWNIADGKVLHKVPLRETGVERSDSLTDNARVTFAPDGQTVLLAAAHMLQFFDVTSGKLIRQLGVPDPISCRPAFSADGILLAAATTKQYVQTWHVPTGAMLARIAPPKRDRRVFNHEDPIGCLAFSPDRKTLAVGRDDEILLYPLVLQSENPRAEAAAAQWEALWQDLASDDAGRAFRALRSMESHPAEAARFLAGELKPVAPADAARVEALLHDLDSPRFAVRRDTFTALAQLADLADAAIARRLEQQPSLEAKRRMDDLVSRIADARGFTPWLRPLRAIEVLERVNTPTARDVLATLSKGATGHRLTEQARDALRRVTPIRPSAIPAEKAVDSDLPPGALSRLGSRAWRHRAPITFISYGPDDKTLAIADDFDVCVWDSATGKATARFQADGFRPAACPQFLVFIRKTDRPSGRRDEVVLADVSTGKMRSLAFQDLGNLWDIGRIDACAGISLDGTRVCVEEGTAKSGRVVCLWDTQSGRLLRELSLDGGGYGCILAPDAGTLLDLHRQEAPELRRMEDGRLLRRLGDGPIANAVFSPDAKMLAVQRRGDDGGIQCLDVETGKTLLDFVERVKALDVAFSRDSRLLAVSLEDRVELWDPRAGKKTLSVKMPSAAGPLAFSADGRTLAVGVGRTVRFIDVASGRLRDADGHGRGVTTVVFARDGNRLASLAVDGPALLWDVGGRLLRSLEFGNPRPARFARFGFGLEMASQPVDSLAFDERGRRLCATDGLRTHVWELATGKGEDRSVRMQHEDLVGPTNVAGTPDFGRPALSRSRLFPWGLLVAQANRQTASVDLCDAATGTQRRTFAWPQPPATNLQELSVPDVVLGISPDGRTLGAFGWDDKNEPVLRLWEIASGQVRAAHRIPAPIEHRRGGFGLGGIEPFYHFSSVTLAPDGRNIALENAGNIHLWDLREERIVRQLFGTSPAFSPDGKLLAVRTREGVRLFDLATGRILCDFGDWTVTCVAFSPDNRTLATGHMDTTILLWDLAGLVEQGKR